VNEDSMSRYTQNIVRALAAREDFKDSLPTGSERLKLFADATPEERLSALKEITYPAKVHAWSKAAKDAAGLLALALFIGWRLGILPLPPLTSSTLSPAPERIVLPRPETTLTP
jgi:hypothetical protein